jgi:hypothetical protein
MRSTLKNLLLASAFAFPLVGGVALAETPSATTAAGANATVTAPVGSAAAQATPSATVGTETKAEPGTAAKAGVEKKARIGKGEGAKLDGSAAVKTEPTKPADKKAETGEKHGSKHHATKEQHSKANGAAAKATQTAKVPESAAKPAPVTVDPTKKL